MAARKTPKPDADLPSEQPPEPQAAQRSAPAPAPAAKGDVFTYTGGSAVEVMTVPPMTVLPGQTVTAASKSQALFMSGHAEFTKTEKGA